MQIDWWTLALQTINFLIVVWLLNRFLYQPIKRVIQDREEADRKAAEIAEEKSKSADKAREEFEALKAELEKQQREIEARLHAEMDKERQAMRADAEKQAQSILENARHKIESERREALVDLRGQIANLAHDLALKALGDGTALEGNGLRKSVNSYLDHLSKSDLDDLRKDTDRTGAWLSVVTASPMPEEQQAGWRKALQSRLGDRDIRFESDGAILGGMELRFPHAVLSFSVADRLRRATEELKG